MKKWLEEIPKGVLNTLGAALALSLLALISKLAHSVLGLSLSDKQISSIQFWLLICATGIFLVVGWFLFFRTRRKLRAVENKLRDSLAVPHKVSDDYEFVKDRGFWVHRQTGQRVCGSCLLPPHEVASPLAPIAMTIQDLAPGMHHPFKTAYFWKCGRKDCGKMYPRPANET